MGRESRETWSKRVERWKDSGLTAKEFAAEVGIKQHSLTWWRWRLASSAESSPKSTRKPGRPRRSSLATTAPVTFVELPATGAAEPLEVVLPSSLRIRVPAGFDAATLRRLLEALDARR